MGVFFSLSFQSLVVFDVKQNGDGGGLNDGARWGVDVVSGRGYPDFSGSWD